MLGAGAKPQEARSVLPNSLKTEIVMTANPREWRHVMKLRTAREAHPQIRQIMCPLLVSFREMWPVLFNDVGDIEHESPATEVFGSYDEAVFEEEELHV
jgi:thymidylate synthase (FAD)